MKGFCSFALIFTLSILCFTGNVYADSTFVKFGSSWKYLDNGTDAGTAWKEPTAAGTDSWPSGPAEFGYGNGDERTHINYGTNASNKNITTYFRTSFDITNKSQFSFFKLKVYLDDGMVVYINGKEVCRTNMGTGMVKYNTPASGELADNGNIIIPFGIPAENFVNGTNYLAVEVHQASVTSEDLTFDVELTGISKADPSTITRGPLLQMVSENAITITWKTSDNTSSRIQYGISENSLASSMTNDALSKDHEIRISGLLPDTKYYYSVGTGDHILKGSYRNYFTTAPQANTTRKIRIGVFGDAGTGDMNQKRVRDSYLQLFKKGSNAELAIMLGDNAYNTGTDYEYQTNFFDVYDDNIFDNHVVFPIPGNHEYYSPGVPYFSVFSLPTAAESGGLASGTESYYSFNYGNIHFIMLNSMGFDNGKQLSDSTGEQALWLKRDLAANAGTHKWTIACLHHPPYTNGTHSSDNEPDITAIRQQLTPILERYGVDAVLAGHSHVYERSFLIQGHTGPSNSFKPTPLNVGGNLVSQSSGRYDGAANSCPYFTIDTIAKKGTVYVVAGSAGQLGGGTNADLPLFYYKNYSGTTGGEHGILYLEVQDNRLDAKFIGLSGTIRDQFTIMKGVNTKKVITTEVNRPVNLTASWIGTYNWIPAPPAGKDGYRVLTVQPEQATKYVYYVRDSIGSSKTCISDTFEITATGVLAITAFKFDAFQKNKKVLLKWTTGKETSTDFFTIEKSSNGRDFNMLTMIKSTFANSSNTNNNTSSLGAISAAAYEFEDNYPVPGNNYYRLTKTNKNGQTGMLGTRIVNFETVKSFSYSVKSNPSNRNMINVVIESSGKQSLQVNVFDMNGKVMFHNDLSVIQGTNNVKVSLLAGTYVINITGTDNTHISEKIIVQ